MEIKFIGTGSSEGFPAIFCKCIDCQRARLSNDPRNRRRRTSVCLNRTILIDLSPDTYSADVNGDIDVSDISDIVITHSHGDHLYLEELTFAFSPWAVDNNNLPLNIYANTTSIEMIRNHFNSKEWWTDDIGERLNLIPVTAGEIFKVQNLRFTALEATHGDENEECLVYLIDEEGKKVFYGTDSGVYPVKTLEHLADNHAEMYIFDCTACLKSSPFESHMGLPEILNVMNSIGLKTHTENKVYLTHFAHGFDSLHENLEEGMRPYKIIPAYDNLKINL